MGGSLRSYYNDGREKDGMIHKGEEEIKEGELTISKSLSMMQKKVLRGRRKTDGARQ